MRECKIKRRPTSQTVCLKLEEKCFRVVYWSGAKSHWQLRIVGKGVPKPLLQHQTHLKHDGAYKHKTMKERASHQLHQLMESSNSWLKRLTHWTVRSGNVTQDMHWELLYILQEIKPRMFEELMTHAYDMELSIGNRGANGLWVPKIRNDKNEINDAKKIVDSVTKESIVVHAILL